MAKMRKNGDIVVENPDKNQTSGCKLVLASILFAAVAVAVDRLVLSPAFLNMSNQKETDEGGVQYVQNDAVDEDILSLFVTYDEDLDGVIDLAEFVKVGNKILNRKVADDHHQDKAIKNVVKDLLDDEDENLTIVSHFTPLILSTMKKYSDDQDSEYFGENEKQMEGLVSWTKASVPIATFSMKEFEAFLPVPDQSLKLSLAQPWYIVESRFEKYGPGLTSNRYYPPVVKGRLAIIYRLLAMFHPRPFLLTRFNPQGSVACVRAENKDYIDVVFRIHAEYQLNEPPLLPFWFTPGQFLGNIVIKKDGSFVSSFHLAVPNNRSLNVDMEWLVQHEVRSDSDTEGRTEMEVDIGFLPQLELQSKTPPSVSNIKWDKEISFDDAYKALEEKFYGFRKVPYVPFKDAISQAKMENKLIHHILLWGALDDQSC